VQPGQYHLFGSKGKSEQEMAALLEKLEKADPGDWAKHLHEFMGSAKHQLDPEPSKLWSSWWNTKGKVTGQYGQNCAGGGTCFDVYDFDHQATLFMLNAYLDMGTWWCFTPFVGLGIGSH